LQQYGLRKRIWQFQLVLSWVGFGIGRFNTQAEIDYVAARVVETVKRLRELSPLYDAQPGC